MLGQNQQRRLDELQKLGSSTASGDAGSSHAPKKVWTTLITNTKYLSGLLTLEYSLRKAGTKYPLIALYTETFPQEGHEALKRRGVLAKEIPYLLPSVPKEYGNDPRFYDCWSKLAPFSLTDYERVVQLDSDMLVLRNMDELMELELDPPEMAGEGNRVYAASHACACNPLRKPHYPPDWVPENCAFTSQHNTPDQAQTEGPPATAGIGSPNGGLVVCNPSQGTYDKILQTLKDGDLTGSYEFADQSLLGERFYGRWVGLPYVYNALKTLRWEGVHHQIWRDEQVKNIHYILSPKPWDETLDTATYETHRWWLEMNQERLGSEKDRGIDDEF
jgi:Glycosyl transferase family 8